MNGQANWYLFNFLSAYLLSRRCQCLKMCSVSDNNGKTGLIWLE